MFIQQSSVALDEFPFSDTIQKLMYVYGDLKSVSEDSALALN